jgi:hypothetical protein
MDNFIKGPWPDITPPKPPTTDVAELYDAIERLLPDAIMVLLKQKDAVQNNHELAPEMVELWSGHLNEQEAFLERCKVILKEYHDA